MFAPAPADQRCRTCRPAADVAARSAPRTNSRRRSPNLQRLSRCPPRRRTIPVPEPPPPLTWWPRHRRRLHRRHLRHRTQCRIRHSRNPHHGLGQAMWRPPPPPALLHRRKPLPAHLLRPANQSPQAAISPGWQSALGAWLQANKTYPDEARRRGDEGRATVRFTVSREGRVTRLPAAFQDWLSHSGCGGRAAAAGAQSAALPAGMEQERSPSRCRSATRWSAKSYSVNLH